VVLWISPFVGGMIKSHTCGIKKPHVCDLIIPPTNGLIHNTTCVWFYHFTYKWTYPQYHMCVIWSFHLQMDLPTKPHVCDFIIPPTNGLIHMCVILSFHLYMDLSTCVWFYHSTYTWTYPHVCDFIIKSHTCGYVNL
jgi:hypothetical protein